MDRWRRESTQPKTTTWSTDLSYAADDEFVELVWENGQVLMQGQSSRARRNSTSNNLQSQIPKIRDKDPCNATNSKWGKSGLMDSVLHDFTAAVPSGEIGLEQEGDIVPWLNYPFDDSLQHDYCSELLPELSGVTVSELSADKRNSCNQSMRGSHGGSASNVSSLDLANQLKISSSEFGESSRSVSGQLYPWSLQESRTPVPFVRPGVSSIMGNSTCNSRHAGCGDSTKAQASTCFPFTKIQKQDSGLPNADSDIMNFSHFSRPAAVVRANLQNVGAMASPGTVGIEGMGGKNRVPAPCSSNLAEPTLLNLNCGMRTEMNSLIQPNFVPLKGDSKQVAVKPLEELRTAENAEAECREDAFRNDMLPNQVLGAAASKGMPDGEKTVEPAVASSSVCSGNSAERASNEPVHNLKRKDRETDDSEGRSEDVEEESVGIRKAAPAQGGKGCKRSRAAEVHNLSERRRRDRINEKMRALQELIPNCNKVDKASMLDEAIEYLKTLQLQVQIMSMGAGMYMPPMMFPGGMQQIHAAHMARFSPLGVGMGMGMGFGMGIGMGMLDMNGGSPGPGRPIFQVPPMQGAHFPIPHPPPVLGPTNFQGMAGPNLHVYGHPSHSLPMSAPRAPLVPLSGGPPVNSSMELNACGMAVPGEVPNPSPPPNSKDLIQDANSQMMYNPDANSPVKQTSGQCQATKEGFEQTSLVLKTDQAQAPDVGSREDANLTRENNILP